MSLYNFGVPSTVEAWFDCLVVPRLTVGEQGGLLGGRTAH
jgi:FMN-dependent NADH-azoreductase